MNDAYITVWVDFRKMDQLTSGEEIVCEAHKQEPNFYELSIPFHWVTGANASQITVRRPKGQW
jgi:hypothetical protein